MPDIVAYNVRMSHEPLESETRGPGLNSPAGSSENRAAESTLPKTVIATGWVSLLTDVATEMTYPLLPSFIQTELGANRATLGLIEGIAETTAALARLPAGVLSDRWRRRKPLMVAGYGLAGVVRPLLGLVTAPWQALLVRFVDRFGKGIRGAPRDALITDVTPATQRGRAFGFHRAMDHTGAAIGPLLAFAFLYFWPGEYRTLFLLTSIPGAIVLAVLWLGVKEPRGQEGPIDPAPERVTQLSTHVLRGPFIWLLAAILLFTLGRASEMMLLLRAEHLGVSVIYLPLLWCGYHLAKSWFSLVGGKLGDRHDARATLLAGWTIHVLAYLGFAFATMAWQAVGLFLLYAVHFGLSEPAERILVAKSAGATERGTAFGWYHLAIGVATLPASAIFGWLWDVSPVGAVLPFCAAAVVAILAELILLRTFWLRG